MKPRTFKTRDGKEYEARGIAVYKNGVYKGIIGIKHPDFLKALTALNDAEVDN